MDQPFEIGTQYQNRDGRYTVLEIEGPRMHVRYADGRYAWLTIATQVRISQVMKDEEPQQPATAAEAAKQKGSKGGPPQAPPDNKQEKLIAEILQDDTAVMEILTRLTIPPGQIDFYRLFLQHPDDYFSMQQIADAVRDSDLNSERSVMRAFGNRISSSPDPRVHTLRPYNSLFFERKRDGGTLLRLRPRVIEVFKSCPQFYAYLLSDTPHWLPDEFGAPDWKHTPGVHERQMAYFGLLERGADAA